MVKKSVIDNLGLLTLLFVLAPLMIPLSTVNAAPIIHLQTQWSKIWINQDSSIDLLYNITLASDSGSINWVAIGQPTSDFTIQQAIDASGKTLSTQKIIQGSDYLVNVSFSPPIGSGKSLGFTVMTNVRGMIYDDQTNPGNVGMLFQPTWWDTASIGDLRLLIVMPTGVQQTHVKTLQGVNYDNIYNDPVEGGRLVVYWQRLNVAPGTKLSFGVSFPKDFIQGGIQYTGINWFLYYFLPNYWFVLLGGGLVAVLGVVTITNYMKKHPYEKPKMKMESLGVRRGLMAVEASWLLGLGLRRSLWRFSIVCCRSMLSG